MKSQILIVDDSGFARRSMRQILEPAGHTVVEASNGQDALEQYFLKRPDLVLLDMVMEGMNGLDVLTKLKELDPAAKVVLATADIQSTTRVETQAAGASGFITKPFNPDNVLNVVSNVLSGGMAWS
jgi:two-component system chemotaxis response regulator CheY